MMKEFYNGFIEHIRQTRSHCNPLLELIETRAGKAPDLEFLISKVDEIQAIRSGMSVLGKKEPDIEDQIAIADELRGYLDAYLIETCERFSEEKVKKKLTKFVEFSHSTDAYVFSTNYDRLIETAASACSLPWHDGFKQQSSHPESEWIGKISTGTGLKLIKLHGSVNWYKEDGSGSIFRLERGYSLPSHEYRLTHGNQALRPLMIIPTLEKSVLQTPYSELLTTFSDALQEIEILLIIGNSLRDEHLKNTIAGRACGLEIVLINPDAEMQKSLFPPETKAYAIPIGMDEFIELGIPVLQKVMDNLADDSGSHHLPSLIGSFVTELTKTAGQLDGMSEESRDLLTSLGTRSDDDRLGLIQSVDESAHPQIVAKVREIAQKSSSESEQVAAIDVLANIQDTGAIEILCEISQGASRLPVRAEAALALQYIAEATGVDASSQLEKMISGDPIVGSLLPKT